MATRSVSRRKAKPSKSQLPATPVELPELVQQYLGDLQARAYELADALHLIDRAYDSGTARLARHAALKLADGLDVVNVERAMQVASLAAPPKVVQS